MDDEKRSHLLHKHVNQANMIREMCRTPGFVLLQEKFKEKVQKATIKLLDADTPAEQALELRRKIQVWSEIEKMLKTIMLTGELSSRAINDLDEFDTTSPLKGQGE